MSSRFMVVSVHTNHKVIILLTAVSTAVRDKVTKTVSEKQLLTREAEDSPTPYDSPAPPPSS